MPFSEELFDRLPVVGILRGFETPHAVEMVGVAVDAGLACVEVTMNSDDAPGQIRALADAYGDRMNVGAGTVTDCNELDAALDAGATYIVMPTVERDVVAACVEREVPVFPGAFTPTEILSAWRAGATMVKLFPANFAGPAYLKSVLAPLSDVRVLATGGIRLENIRDWLDAGARGFGVGSPLFDKTRMAARDNAWLRDQVQRFAEVFDENRN